MKKLFSKLMFVALSAMTFVACEDVPEPYPMPDQPNNKADGSLPYESGNMSNGWKLFSVTPDQPWSTGSSYVQATGYQKWDGADQKSNREVEGWLVSPQFNTTEADTRGDDMKVKLSFEYTIKYTNNVQGWENYHKVFASRDFDGENVDKAHWVELNFKPVASPYPSNDWTCYSSGDIQLPDEMCNQEKVFIGFWFKAPASGSTTWELKNFKIEEGEATEGGDTGGNGTKDEPLTVAEALQKSAAADAWVRGFIVGYVDGKALKEGARFDVVTSEPVETNVLIADSPNETDLEKCMPIQLPQGKVRDGVNLKANPNNLSQEVLFHGGLESYFGVMGMKNTDYAKIGDKEIDANGGDTPVGEAKGDGTLNNPFNPVGAILYAQSLGADTPSDKEVYIKGKISKIASKGTFAESGNFGNATFYISEDGSSTDEFYIFRTLYLENKQWVSGQTDIKVGDEVIVCGKVINYRGNTPETYQVNKDGNVYNSYLYSLNGKTKAEGQQPVKTIGTLDNPVSAQEAWEAIDALAEGATTEAYYYVKGIISHFENNPEDIGPNSTSGKKYKDWSYYITDQPGSNYMVLVYRGKYLGNTDFTSGDQLKQNDEVVVYGKLQKYKDSKTSEVKYEMAQGNYIVKHNGKTDGGSPTPGGDTDFVAETGDNGTFEAWTNGLPDNWVTKSTACNATLSQDRDARSGNYAVRVAGSSSNNKRLGYKELKLKAGTYQVIFYAKAVGEGCSINPGIVPIKSDGTPGTYAYKGYIDNVSTNEWQYVVSEIEVKTDGTYCFVIMNQKKESAVDVLIDDFTVTLDGQPIIR